MITMAGLKQLNKQAGYYFFSKDTMKFFDSRIESKLYKSGYFITSEKKCFSDYRRVYAVRKAETKTDSNGTTIFTGKIDNMTDAKFNTIEEARDYIKQMENI